MSHPKISVIIPVYNVEKYLPKCIESVLAQTYTDFELILINDGSSDNSGHVCDEYATRDQRIRVFHKTNGGVSSARNLGIAEAKGDWITFIDSDDTIDATYLENFEPNESNNYCLSIQGYRIYNNSKLERENSVDINKNVDLQECLSDLELKNVLNSPVCKLFNSEIIKNNSIRFDKNTSYGEDHIFTLEYLFLCTNGVIKISSKIGYNYLMFTNSASLTHRQVPIQQLTYYYNTCRRLLFGIMAKLDKDPKLVSAINYRAYSTLRKLTNEIVSLRSAPSLSNIRKELLDKSIYGGLALKHKIIAFILFHLDIRSLKTFNHYINK